MRIKNGELPSVEIFLPSKEKEIEIHLFADEHIGDMNSDIPRLKERIKYVAEKPNAYCILNGDLMDNATKSSIGDTYSSALNPMEQLKRTVEIFSPIQDKVLLMTHGNHEARTYNKEGIDLSYMMAVQLGIEDRYTNTCAVLFLRVGEDAKGRKTNDGKPRPITYTLFALHGSGGGRKEGGKINRLTDMSSIVDTDIYIHSHTHLPITSREGFFRIDARNHAVVMHDKLFVNTASNLDYGGYGAFKEFKPNSKKTPVIYLNTSKKEFYAEL